MLTAIVIVVSIAVVAALVVWMWTTRRVPERAATHTPRDRPRRQSDEQLSEPDDGGRPAGPGAEAQRPVTGDATPGPPPGQN